MSDLLVQPNSSVPMMEYGDIAVWTAASGREFHKISKVASLPNPVFQCEGREMVSFSSNNYLALAHDPRLVAAAHRGLDLYGVGNCESRLLGGDMDLYRDLEGRLAFLKEKETALLFATGYLTNLGVLSSLPNAGIMARAYGFRPSKRLMYTFFSDESNHISIREGIRMSGAHKVTYRHRDMEDLDRKLKASMADCKIIVTDGVFSMDGDIAPLPDLLRLADEYNAIVYVDDAHGTGVLGKNGGGTSEWFGVKSSRLISMGTLSKAYGAIGGFIATERYIADILRFTCSAYGFTSTLPPDQALAVIEAMDIVRNEPARRQRLWDNQRYFVARLDELGFRVISRQSCIVPVMVGDEQVCEACAHELEANGFHVDAVAFPGVKMGQSRLRFNLNANHTHEQMNRLLAVLQSAGAASRE
jgi:glycine C-acetyltransferase